MISAATRAFQPRHGLWAPLNQKVEEQPSADTPRHTEAARQVGRPGIESAVNIYLFVDGRAIAAIRLCRCAGDRLHAAENLDSELAASNSVKGKGRACLLESREQVAPEARLSGVDDVLRPKVP